MPRRTRHDAKIADARKAIHDANVVAFLLDIVAGKPAPVRDEAGRIIDWTDPPELPLRVSTATALARKVLPDLAASQIDLETSGGTTLQIVLGEGLTPPGSRTIEHEDDEHDDAPHTPEQLPRDATPVWSRPSGEPLSEPEAVSEPHSEPEAPIRRRRRRQEPDADA